jgi:hypothetical protein
MRNAIFKIWDPKQVHSSVLAIQRRMNLFLVEKLEKSFFLQNFEICILQNQNAMLKFWKKNTFPKILGQNMSKCRFYG